MFAMVTFILMFICDQSFFWAAPDPTQVYKLLNNKKNFNWAINNQGIFTSVPVTLDITRIIMTIPAPIISVARIWIRTSVFAKKLSS